jgi:hypothetical protein
MHFLPSMNLHPFNFYSQSDLVHYPVLAHGLKR